MAFVKAVIAYSVFLAVTASIFAIMNQFQPKAYMDEVFHIPQAQKYCQGQFREVLFDRNVIAFDFNEFIAVGSQDHHSARPLPALHWYPEPRQWPRQEVQSHGRYV